MRPTEDGRRAEAVDGPFNGNSRLCQMSRTKHRQLRGSPGHHWSVDVLFYLGRRGRVLVAKGLLSSGEVESFESPPGTSVRGRRWLAAATALVIELCALSAVKFRSKRLLRS
jgi:hypothetical protein